MVAHVDNGCMFAITILIGVLALCVLSAFYGVDSRHDEPGRHRTNLL